MKTFDLINGHEYWACSVYYKPGGSGITYNCKPTKVRVKLVSGRVELVDSSSQCRLWLRPDGKYCSSLSTSNPDSYDYYMKCLRESKDESDALYNSMLDDALESFEGYAAKVRKRLNSQRV